MPDKRTPEPRYRVIRHFATPKPDETRELVEKVARVLARRPLTAREPARMTQRAEPISSAA